MNKKFKNILKIIIILFILLLVNFSKVYALEEQMIEKYYKKIETEDGVFYKRKSLKELDDLHISMNSSGISTKIYDDYLKLKEIIEEKVDTLIKEYISKDYTENQRIREDYKVFTEQIYSISEEKPYVDGDDIVAVVEIYAHPIDGNNSYWNENFSNNELYYDKYKDEYSVYIYYFIRLSKNLETGEYEIVYIDLEPENYDQAIIDLKEKGLDLENLDVKKLLNTNYADEIKAVSSTNTIVDSTENNEYNSKQVQEIKNISNVIRYVSVAILIIIIIIFIIKFNKNRKDENI